MEILARLFPYAKTLAGVKRVFEQAHLFVDTSAPRARRNLREALLPVGAGGGVPEIGRAHV